MEIQNVKDLTDERCETAGQCDVQSPAVQLNLTVLHDPVPSGSGAPEVAIFRLQRIVAFR